MDHPNSNYLWDQRIPNEPLFERNFLIERPPIILQDSPSSTSQCTPVCHSRPWLVMDKNTEKQMMSYWHHNVVNRDCKGPNTKPKKKNAKSLKKMTERNPDRPWLHGIHRNIDRDSLLSNRNCYNPKDCINSCVQNDLAGLDRIANEAMLRQMTVNQLTDLGSGCNVWNRPTSVKMTEPANFDYEKYLKTNSISSC